jgi:mono/diheme cytochrome c family protein
MQRRMARSGLALVFLACVMVQAQTESEKSKPTQHKSSQGNAVIQNVRPTQTDPSSGKEMFFLYCASCHGLDGQGEGSASGAFKRPPPDLTLLSKRNSGKYPTARVEAAIQGDASIPAHGSREMPMWGQVFRGMQNDQVIVKLRVHNLAEYVKGIQR